MLLLDQKFFRKLSQAGGDWPENGKRKKSLIKIAITSIYLVPTIFQTLCNIYSSNRYY